VVAVRSKIAYFPIEAVFKLKEVAF
jgi:hypothetical protein